MNQLNKKKIYFIALSFLVCLLIFNFVMRQVIETKLLDNSTEKFSEISLDILHLVERRSSQYSNLVLFGRKLFESSEAVTREEFEHFYDEYFSRNEDTLSGVENVAFVEKIADKKQFTERIRNEKTKTAFKFLYFNIASQNPNNTTYVFNYLYPHKNNSRFFGFDPGDSEELKRAFGYAAHNAKQVLTNEVDLFGESYLLLIDPVYVTNPNLNIPREETIKGFIVLTLKKDKFYENIFAYQEDEIKKINLKVSFNDNPQHIFYEDNSITEAPFSGKARMLKKRIETQFANRSLMVEVQTYPSFQLTEFEKVFPEINFVLSSVMVVLFFIIMITFRTRCESTNPDES